MIIGKSRTNQPVSADAGEVEELLSPCVKKLTINDVVINYVELTNKLQVLLPEGYFIEQIDIYNEIGDTIEFIYNPTDDTYDSYSDISVSAVNLDLHGIEITSTQTPEDDLSAFNIIGLVKYTLYLYN